MQFEDLRQSIPVTPGNHNHKDKSGELQLTDKISPLRQTSPLRGYESKLSKNNGQNKGEESNG